MNVVRTIFIVFFFWASPFYSFYANAGIASPQLPSQAGNSGKVLGTNGSILSWVSGGGGGSVSITPGSGLSTSPNPITGTGSISCLVSSNSVDGCLSHTDWATFNGKQAAGSYITALTGDVTASGPGSSAASVVRLQGRNMASTAPSNGQVLTWNTTNSDWEPATATSGAAGSNTQIQYNSSGSLAGSAGLAWDNTNSLLEVGPGVFINAYAGKDNITSAGGYLDSTVQWQATQTAFAAFYLNAGGDSGNTGEVALFSNVGISPGPFGPHKVASFKATGSTTSVVRFLDYGAGCLQSDSSGHISSVGGSCASGLASDWGSSNSYASEWASGDPAIYGNSGAASAYVLQTSDVTTGNSAEIDFISGAQTNVSGTGRSGNSVVTTGDNKSTALADNALGSGKVFINSGNTVNGSPGDIQITPGSGSAGNSAGGNIQLITSAGSGTGATGKIQFQPADTPSPTVGWVWTATDSSGSGDWQPSSGGGGAPSHFIFSNSTTTGGFTGPALVLDTSQGDPQVVFGSTDNTGVGSSNPAAAVYLVGGNVTDSTASGSGASINITAGSVTGGGTGNPGNFNISGGVTNGSGAPVPSTISGTGTSFSTGSGGDLNLLGGTGGGSGTGGNVVISGGNAGTHGNVNIGSSNTTSIILGAPVLTNAITSNTASDISITQVTASSNINLFAPNTGNINLQANGNLVGIVFAGHIVANQPNPTVTSCGTSPSISGSDSSGRITVGATTSTCTVTFANTWANAPVCIVQDESASTLLTPAPTTTALVITGAAIGGNSIAYHCIGY